MKILNVGIAEEYDIIHMNAIQKNLYQKRTLIIKRDQKIMEKGGKDTKIITNKRIISDNVFSTNYTQNNTKYINKHEEFFFEIIIIHIILNQIIHQTLAFYISKI